MITSITIVYSKEQIKKAQDGRIFLRMFFFFLECSGSSSISGNSSTFAMTSPGSNVAARRCCGRTSFVSYMSFLLVFTIFTQFWCRLLAQQHRRFPSRCSPNDNNLRKGHARSCIPFFSVLLLNILIAEVNLQLWEHYVSLPDRSPTAQYVTTNCSFGTSLKTLSLNFQACTFLADQM